MGCLQGKDVLCKLFGNSGLDNSKRAVVYDPSDGRRGAMMSWELEYLGRVEVSLLNVVYERWVSMGYKVSQENLPSEIRLFQSRINHRKRVGLNDVKLNGRIKLIDLRSTSEYFGEVSPIKTAITLPWTEVLGSDYHLLGSGELLVKKMETLGINRFDNVMTYCTCGPRAAIGYLALKRVGYDVKVFDGGLGEWYRSYY